MTHCWGQLWATIKGSFKFNQCHCSPGADHAKASKCSYGGELREIWSYLLVSARFESSVKRKRQGQLLVYTYTELTFTNLLRWLRQHSTYMLNCLNRELQELSLRHVYKGFCVQLNPLIQTTHRHQNKRDCPQNVHYNHPMHHKTTWAHMTEPRRSPARFRMFTTDSLVITSFVFISKHVV